MSNVSAKLKEMGFSFDSVLVDAGDYKTESKFRVTVKKNNQEYTVDYHKGCGLRRWTQIVNLDRYHGAKHSTITLHPLLNPTSYEERQALLNYTEPEPVTLDEIIYSLHMDATCVCFGETFEDFCDELGYDNDSRKAEKFYHACRDTLATLIRMGVDLEKLGELFQDY